MNAAFGFLLISTWDSTTTENIFLTRFRINPLIPLPTPPPPPPPPPPPIKFVPEKNLILLEMQHCLGWKVGGSHGFTII